MRHSIFKRKWTDSRGRARRGKYYQLRITHDDGRREQLSLGVTDKRVAEQRAREIIEEREREAAGIIAPKRIREAAAEKVTVHLAAFLEQMRVYERSSEHIRKTKQRASLVIRECGWEYPRDITAESFIDWRNRHEASRKTLNEYYNAVAALVKWMYRNGLIEANPIQGRVERLSLRGVEREQRRSLTIEECERLIAGSGPRGIVYRVALRTGLRRGELAKIEWRHVELDGERPRIQIPAKIAKSRRLQSVPLRPDVVDALRVFRPTDAKPHSPVFGKLVPSRRRRRADFDAAGIEHETESGRADFHALRHTFCTHLHRAGVGLVNAQALMRHSDVRLTAKTYTDESALPLAECVSKMPEFKERTQICHPDLGATGPDVSSTVASRRIRRRTQIKSDAAVSPHPTGRVASSHNVSGKWSRGESKSRRNRLPDTTEPELSKSAQRCAQSLLMRT